jgi:hypothetical protein
MFKLFVHHYKIDMNKCNRKFINLIFEEKVFLIFYFYNPSIIRVLLNETNFSYSYSISNKLYDLFKYNSRQEDQSLQENQNSVIVVINNGMVSEKNEIFNLDSKFNEDEKMKFLFERYHKLFLVLKKGMKLPQNLQFKHYKEISKYI